MAESGKGSSSKIKETKFTEMTSQESRVENSNNLHRNRIALISCLVALLAISCYIFFIKHPILEGTGDEIEQEIMSLFVSYDANADGLLDPYEFVPIAHRLLYNKETSAESKPVIIETWDHSGEQLTVKALFQPLVLASMTKLQDILNFVSDHQALDGLKAWKTAITPAATFAVNAFSIFLPPSDVKPTELGKAWYILEPHMTKFGPQPSSNRFFPPSVHGSAAIFHRLLAMVHPRPFLWTRFGPQGTAACIRAENEKYLEITFRLHAEFQLNKPPLLPFWFSPAMFAGSLIISRDGSHIVSFQMAVPNNRSLNVDMEWLLNRPDDSTPSTDANDPKNETEKKEADMEVDIGYLPQMEYRSQGQSFLMDSSKKEEKHDDIQVEAIKWRSEITRAKADNILEKHFYPFKKIDYLPFKEAFAAAKAEDKLVHHIVMWGALDDQSC